MEDGDLKIGDFLLINKLFDSFDDEVTVRTYGAKNPIHYFSDCNIEWKESGLGYYNNYIFKCIGFITDSQNIVIRIIEKDTMKKTKYTITCHQAYIEIDKKLNRTHTIDKFLNI